MALKGNRVIFTASFLEKKVPDPRTCSKLKSVFQCSPQGCPGHCWADSCCLYDSLGIDGRLSGFGGDAIEEGALAQFQTLEELSLSDNNLESFCHDKLDNLISLDIKNNNFANLQSLRHLTRLERLAVAGNPSLKVALLLGDSIV